MFNKTEILNYYKGLKEKPNKSFSDRVFGDRIYFLENVLLPYKNYDLGEYTRNFFFCIAKLHLNFKYSNEETLAHCLEVNKRLKKPLPYKDLCNEIYFVYDETFITKYGMRQVDIRLSNKAIRIMLNVTEEEQNLFHDISFFEEHKKLKEAVMRELYPPKTPENHRKNYQHKANTSYGNNANKKTYGNSSSNSYSKNNYSKNTYNNYSSNNSYSNSSYNKNSYNKNTYSKSNYSNSYNNSYNKNYSKKVNKNEYPYVPAISYSVHIDTDKPGGNK